MSKDARFAKLSSDPRFIKPKKVAQKVQVDERFANLLQDAGKAEKRVDKRGRRVNASKAEKEDLKRFYKVQDDEQTQPEASTSKRKDGAAGMSAGERALKMARGEIVEESSDESSDEEDSDASELDSDADSALEGQSDSDGHSEFSIDLAEDPDDEATAFPDEEEYESETEEDINTTRLAMVNMDWDHIRAVDLFKVLQSALQVTHVQGSVKRVSIYPSEFGKERMEREEREGPPKELFANEDDQQELADIDEDDVDERMVVQEAEDKGEEVNSKALRRYQLERLRYYYAVAEFDSVKSARAAFLEVQGTEFERSANIFELRAIPDDMTFDDQPKDTATSTDDHSAYEGGLDYVTTALRHSKVKLTWDQDDPRRSRVTRIDLSKMPKDKVDQIDYADYLASDSSDESAESDGEGQDRAARFRAALGLSAEPKKSSKKGLKEEAGDMEITFKPALESGRASDSDSEEDRDETTIERYKRKEKERRERRKQARRAEAGDASQDEEEDEFFEGFEDEDKAFADALAAHDAGMDDVTLSKQQQQQTKKMSKAAKRAAKAKEVEEAAKQRAELELLVDENEDAKHFDMEKIWKAEREEAAGVSRSAKRKRGARAAKKEAEAAQAKANDQFVLNAKDDRFKSLHEDPAFAIDPSNPKYKKTKNMQLLLEETRKARDGKLAAAGAASAASDTSANPAASTLSAGGGSERDLDSLVSAIKRKSDGAKGKKSKKPKL